MTVLDPLVRLQTSKEAGLRGWAVAAALINQLQEADQSGALDVPGILAAVISDLDEAELKELDRQLFGPLMESDSSNNGIQLVRFSEPQLRRLMSDALADLPCSVVPLLPSGRTTTSKATKHSRYRLLDRDDVTGTQHGPVPRPHAP